VKAAKGGSEGAREGGREKGQAMFIMPIVAELFLVRGRASRL